MGGRGSGSRMTSSSTSGERSVASGVSALNSLPVSNGMSRVSYEQIKQYENVLSEMPVGAEFSLRVEAGTSIFRKISGSNNGRWEVSRAPWNEPQQMSSFDAGHYLAGMGNIRRGRIQER